MAYTVNCLKGNLQARLEICFIETSRPQSANYIV